MATHPRKTTTIGLIIAFTGVFAASIILTTNPAQTTPTGPTPATITPTETPAQWDQPLHTDGYTITLSPPEDHSDEYGPPYELAVFHMPLTIHTGQYPINPTEINLTATDSNYNPVIINGQIDTTVPPGSTHVETIQLQLPTERKTDTIAICLTTQDHTRTHIWTRTAV